METRPERLERVMQFLKKWWKLILGFFSAIFLIFWSSKNKSSWRAFHKNSKENFEGQIEAEKIASEKLEKAIEKAEVEHTEAVESVKRDTAKKKSELKKKIEKEKSEAADSGISKLISEHSGAELIEIEDDE